MKKHYTPSQITLHWLAFIAICTAFATMELKGFAARGGSVRTTLVLVHYLAGCCVLVLMALRIGLKTVHRDPAIIPPPPRWQTISSKAVHGILYLMFIALPVLGLASLYYGQVEWKLLGITMPVAAVADKTLQHTLKEYHELIANTGYYIIALHIVAALFHHYIKRDNTLERMLPLIKKEKKSL